MKRLLLLSLTVISLFCCKQPAPKDETQKLIEETDHFIDSMKAVQNAQEILQASVKNALFDTAGLSASPVKILSAKLVGREYSNYKDIRLSWKNVGSKRISAIRFRWYGLNAFGEPADMGSSYIQRGFGGGFSDDKLSPGKTDSGTWEIMSKDGKKVVLAWPYEVVFEDGTKWELK